MISTIKLRTISQGTTSFIPLAGFVAISIMTLSLFRLGYFILYSDRVLQALNPVAFFVLGVRADLIQIGYYSLIPLLAFPLTLIRNSHTLWLKLSMVWFAIALLLILILELSTPAFLAQY